MHHLTLEEINAIKSSFNQIAAKNVSFGKQFFITLFEMAPLVKPMFKREIGIIEIHFDEIISTAVSKVDNFEEIKPVLFELGKKHKDYGAEKTQFNVVKSALILTIQSELRQQSNELIESSWANYYDNIAAVMIEGLESDT